MKKKILITAVSLLTVAACVGVVSAYGLPELKSGDKSQDSNSSEYEHSEKPLLNGFCTKEEKIALQKEKERITAELDKQEDSYIDSSLIPENDSELEEKFRKSDEEDKKLDQYNLNAYSIVAKYLGEEYSRTELIDNYDVDIDYMEKMCELYNSGKLTDDEKKILYDYVDRRTSWIEDRDLRHHFVNEIGAPY